MQKSIKDLIEENSRCLFGVYESGGIQGGALSDIFETYLSKKNLRQRFFKNETTFVSDENVSNQYIVPSVLYDQKPDHGHETLGYIYAGSGFEKGNPGLIFNNKRNPSDFRFYPLPLHEQSRYPRSFEMYNNGSSCFTRNNACYFQGEIFRDRQYDHITQAKGDLFLFKEDEEIAIENICIDYEYWDFEEIDKYLQAINIFWSSLKYGAIMAGKPLKNGLAETDTDIISSQYFDLKGLRIDFKHNTLYQKNIEHSTKSDVIWTAIFTEISILNRWAYIDQPMASFGLIDVDVQENDFDIDAVHSRITALEKNKNRGSLIERTSAKTAIAKYCKIHDLDVSTVSNVSELARKISKLYNLEVHTIRRAITEERKNLH